MRVTKYKIELNQNRHNVIVKDDAVNYQNVTNKFDSPEAVVQLMNDCFRLSSQAEEYVYMLAFDTKCHLLGVFEVTHGTVNASMISPREIYVRALLCGASCIMLVHNHPSGDTEPSTDDVKSTKRVKEAGQIVGIGLVDHIIIGDGYCSLLERQLM